MDEQQRAARAIEGRTAQRLTIAEANDLVENEGRTGRDIKDGLEVAGLPNHEAGIPADAESIDPGWNDFQQRQIDEAAAPWEVAANATAQAVYERAVNTYDNALDDEQILRAALDVATLAPGRYGEFLSKVEWDDPEYVPLLAASVSRTLSESAATIGEHEFQQRMAESEWANVEHAQGSLDALAEVRGMTPADVDRAARTYMQATGQPLRAALTNVMPEDRASFLQEVAIQADVVDQAERVRAFKASFFGPSTDINSGLVVRGQPSHGGLPPAVTDPEFNAWKVEQSIRARDAERVVAPKPGDNSADEIRRGVLLGEDERDWRSGLTTDTGRRTSVQEIAQNDPDSLVNQQARQLQAQAMKLANLTGGRRT